MVPTNESTTLICLFHHDGQARAAMEDLAQAGLPAGSITTFSGQDGRGTDGSNHEARLTELGVPARDVEHLSKGLADGGTIVAVRSSYENDLLNEVERIFANHKAKKIDETEDDAGYGAPVAGAGLAAGAAALKEPVGERTIPVVEEELEVGKRTVDRGGVRVFRRVVEIPAEETVQLRDERVFVERNLVDRPASEADYAAGGRVVELTETAEEAVVGKTAHVVEEVVVGKEVGQRTETVRDTVRRTEVEVEELPGQTVTSGKDFRDKL